MFYLRICTTRKSENKLHCIIKEQSDNFRGFIAEISLWDYDDLAENTSKISHEDKTAKPNKFDKQVHNTHRFTKGKYK